MPAQMTGTIGNLSLGFLHAIFAKEREAAIGGFVNDGAGNFLPTATSCTSSGARPARSQAAMRSCTAAKLSAIFGTP